MHLSGVGVSVQKEMENAPWDPDQAAVLADLDPELHRLPPHTGEVVGWPGGNMTGMAGVGAELARISHTDLGSEEQSRQLHANIVRMEGCNLRES